MFVGLLSLYTSKHLLRMYFEALNILGSALNTLYILLRLSLFSGSKFTHSDPHVWVCLGFNHTLPETNFKFKPEKCMVGRLSFPFGASNGLFSGANLLLVFGSVTLLIHHDPRVGQLHLAFLHHVMGWIKLPTTQGGLSCYCHGRNLLNFHLVAIMVTLPETNILAPEHGWWKMKFSCAKAHS